MSDTSVKIAGSGMKMSVPFSKIDVEKRMVHGFATVDNLDSQDDIVLYEASIDAFNRFRGNIREMHDLKAVGKMVSFRPESLYDPVTGNMHEGIFVSTYVSKGAQDTWEKVLDGTLTGFSIGGEIIESSDKFDEDLQRTVRIVQKYDLVELSLVDNPANQLANVVSFEKGVKAGYLLKTKMENVFFCMTHNVVQLTAEPAARCFECQSDMLNIGFVESDDPEKAGVVKSLITEAKYIPHIDDMVDFDEGFGKVDAIYTAGEISLLPYEEIIKAKENNPVALISVYEKNNDRIIKTDHRVIKNLSSLTKMKEVQKVSNEETAVVVEDSEATEIVEAVEPELTEQAPEEKVENNDLAEIKELIKGLSEALAGIPGLIKSVADSAEAAERRAEQAEEVAKAATADLAKAQTANEELGKRLDGVESATAFRKSADVGEIRQTPQEVQSVWGGHFLDGRSGS